VVAPAMNILSLLPNPVLLAPSDAIMALDCEGQIRFWNPGSTPIFRFGAEEAIGQSLDFVIPENLKARHGKAIVGC
jgi:PAS domain S-box-containing protein